MASGGRVLGVVRAFAKHLARWKSRISYACACWVGDCAMYVSQDPAEVE